MSLMFMNEQEALVADLPSGRCPFVHSSLKSSFNRSAIRYQLTPPAGPNLFQNSQADNSEKLIPVN